LEIAMARPAKYIKKVLELRARLWPEIDFDKQLWYRKTNDGFITMPRTMPLIISIIDDLTKGGPAGSTYMELWCRTYDEMYVSLSKAREIAFHSGFTGQRAERTWAEKVRKLDELGFISVRPGQAGPLSHALVLNPYVTIKRLYEQGNVGVTKEKYNALVERAIEIGAEFENQVAPPARIAPGSVPMTFTVPGAVPPAPPTPSSPAPSTLTVDEIQQLLTKVPKTVA
jgi:hypothetical protein